MTDYEEGWIDGMMDVHRYCAQIREHMITTDGLENAYKNNYFKAVTSIGAWAVYQANRLKK